MDRHLRGRDVGHAAGQRGERGRVWDFCPDLSIEVDNLGEVHRRAVAGGFAIEYGPAVEPWGVRRFYVRDPFGRLVNILAHTA